MNSFRSGIGCVYLTLFLYSSLFAATNDNASLGINLSGVTYWSAEIASVDLFKYSQTWKSQAPGKSYAQGGTLDLTPGGKGRTVGRTHSHAAETEGRDFQITVPQSAFWHGLSFRLHTLTLLPNGASCN